LEDGFYFVYVLLSEKYRQHYADYSSHLLSLRIEQHHKGSVSSTKNRRPLKLICFEAILNQQDATKREKYFKTHYGERFYKNDTVI